MVEIDTATISTTHNESGTTDKVGLMLAHDAGRDGKGDQSVGGGKVAEMQTVPEEALETHEVVEINKFTERKEWIEEKIKVSRADHADV